jgi:DNA-binding LacI/PurR family transcriptional regulator
VGYDDILIASHTVPALTTLRMPISEIVGYAVDRAITLARETNVVHKPSFEVFAPELVVRDSTARPSQGA